MKALPCTPLRVAVHVALLIAGSLGTAHLAVAQEPTPDQQSAIRSNCRSDFMANCSGVPRGGKEAMQCLKDHVAVLSSGCQQAVKAVMPAARRQASGTPCHSGTGGSSGAPSGTSAGGASDSSTRGSRRSRRCSGRCRYGTGRDKAAGSCRINAASGAGTAGGQTCSTGGEKRCETSSELTTDRCRPACGDRGCPAPDFCPGAHQVPCGIPRSLLRR